MLPPCGWPCCSPFNLRCSNRRCSVAEIADVDLAHLSAKAQRRSKEHRGGLVAGVGGAKGKRRSRVYSIEASLPVRLSLVNVAMENDLEMVECRLETAHHPTVSFKFCRFTDQPEDIAAQLVSCVAGQRLVRRFGTTLATAH